MALSVQTRTAADFEAFVALPENHERRFEFVGGEIIEVPSNPYVSKIAMLIVGALLNYLRQHDQGHVTGEGGGYIVNGERYAPDVAFISYARQPELAHTGYNPNPPELVVEVISDSANRDEQTTLRRKLANYLAVDALVWVVDPFARTVEVYAAGSAARVIDASGTLDGGAVLPGFTLNLSEIFPAIEG